QCRGGRDQQQGPGDHQAYLWTEVSEESVGPIDPGLESGVASDRLLDRAHPPDGQGPEGPIRLVLHLKTEEPNSLRSGNTSLPFESLYLTSSATVSPVAVSMRTRAIFFNLFPDLKGKSAS